MRDVRIRVDEEFDKIIRKIQKEKIKNGTAEIENKKLYSSRRITLAITRHEYFQKVIKDIINQRLE